MKIFANLAFVWVATLASLGQANSFPKNFQCKLLYGTYHQFLPTLELSFSSERVVSFKTPEPSKIFHYELRPDAETRGSQTRDPLELQFQNYVLNPKLDSSLKLPPSGIPVLLRIDTTMLGEMREAPSKIKVAALVFEGKFGSNEVYVCTRAKQPL